MSEYGTTGGIILTQENRRTRKITCPNATLYITDPTWTDLSMNPGLRDDKPATNCLCCGTAVQRHTAKFTTVSAAAARARTSSHEHIEIRYIPLFLYCLHAYLWSDRISVGRDDHWCIFPNFEISFLPSRRQGAFTCTCRQQNEAIAFRDRPYFSKTLLTALK